MIVTGPGATASDVVVLAGRLRALATRSGVALEPEVWGGGELAGPWTAAGAEDEDA